MEINIYQRAQHVVNVGEIRKLEYQFALELLKLESDYDELRSENEKLQEEVEDTKKELDQVYLISQHL